MSFRVVKKFFFKRPRIKFCLMRTMIMNKIETQKSLEAKRTNQYRGKGWNMVFYFAIQRMHSIYQLTSSQNGLI